MEVLIGAVLPCFAAIYLRADMYILVTAELLLGRETKAMVPEFQSLVKTKICAERDL